MTATDFDRFLAEAVRTDRETDGGLGPDELYGLYTSWCLINNTQPESPKALWTALKDHRITPERNGLAMTGPAAADYILASDPGIV
jgi:hypothetical protein